MNEPAKSIVVKPPSVNPQKTFKDITGEKFGLLTITRYAGRDKWNKGVWLCTCECGVTIESTTQNLNSGNTASCGCEQARIAAETQYKHGMAKTQQYAVWVGIMSRCYNPKNKAFYRYGGRGIQMCDRWRFGEDGKTGFECFYADTGDRPSTNHSIDRWPNNDGNYEPCNWRWATRKQQSENSRPKGYYGKFKCAGVGPIGSGIASPSAISESRST